MANYEGFIDLGNGLYTDGKKIGKLVPNGWNDGWHIESILRQEYQFEKYKKATDDAYDKYVKIRDMKIKSSKDIERLEKAKKAYLKAYKQEEERNLTIINEEKYGGDTSRLKGKHIKEVNNFKNNWKNEIKTLEQLETKEKEVKEFYEKYKASVKENKDKWNPTVIQKNKESYQKTLKDIKNWKNELKDNDTSPMSEYSGRTREGISYAQEGSLNKMSLSELKEMANKYGIKTDMSKAKLISALISVFNK